MTAFFPVLNSPSTLYTVQPKTGFLDPAYYAAEGAVHPAVDFNSTAGGDSDMGDPVYAADDGVVVDATFGSYIGGIIEIQHADGSISGYWHERNIHVRKGQRVRAGDMIGQMGKGGPASGGRMTAHLHFYVKKKGVRLASDYWVSLYIRDRLRAEAFVRENYHPPLDWLRERGALKALADLQNLRPDPARGLGLPKVFVREGGKNSVLTEPRRLGSETIGRLPDGRLTIGGVIVGIYDDYTAQLDILGGASK